MVASLKIAVIEDHDSLRDTTVDALSSMGYQVLGFDSVESLLEDNPTTDFNILVVDLNLPGEDGLTFSKRMRTVYSNIGIVMVTARNQLSDKVAGYSNGADIYLTKPTAMEEIAGAIQALSHRINISNQSQNFKLRPSKLSFQGQLGNVSLSEDESQMLVALSRSPNQQMEYWQLIEIMEKSGNSVSKNVLEVKIFRLRKKLTQAGANNSITAVRGLGYRLGLNLSILE